MGERDAPYRDPAVYDALYAQGTAADVDVLERLATHHVRGPARGRPWLEPACGSGRYLRVLAGRGRRVAGYDLSKAMIDDARARLARRGLEQRASLAVGDMGRFDPHPLGSPFGFAFCLVNTLRHLKSDEEMLAHFELVAARLARGAAYVVGLHVADYGAERPSEDDWRAARGSLRVWQRVRYDPAPSRRARFERVTSRLTVARGSRREQALERYALRAYDEAQWRALIARSPLALVEITDEFGRPTSVRPGAYHLLVHVRRDDARLRSEAT